MQRQHINQPTSDTSIVRERRSEAISEAVNEGLGGLSVQTPSNDIVE